MTDAGPPSRQSVTRMRDDNDVAGLSRTLREADQGTAAAAASYLAEIGTPECAQVLLGSLRLPASRSHTDTAIIRGLGQIREVRAVPVLVAILQAPGNSWEGPREDAIWALGRIGDRRAVPAILTAVRAPFIRSALEALERIGGPDVAPGLLVRLWGCVSSNNPMSVKIPTR